MTNPYRAMCAELHTAIQLYTGQNPAAANVPPAELVCRLMDAMAASAALLAQPQSPADGEVEYALLEVRVLVDELCNAGKWIAAERLERAATLLQRQHHEGNDN